MRIVKIFVAFLLIAWIGYATGEDAKSTSLIDIYDLGVNFGQMEAYSAMAQETEFLGTALRRAKVHATNASAFETVDAIFEPVETALSANSPISKHLIIEHARRKFEDQLERNDQHKNVVDVFGLGINLGQIEAFAQLKKESEFIDLWALPRAKNHATRAGRFDRIQNIFATLERDVSTIEDFESRTLAARLTFREQINTDRSVFRAGAYKLELSVDAGEKLVGYAPRGQHNPSPAVRADRLYVRSLVLDVGAKKIAIASIDSLLVYDTTLARVKRQVQNLTGIDNVLLIATHTHSGPEFSATDEAIRPSQRVREEQIVTAITTAAGRLEPAEIGVAQIESRQAINRVHRTYRDNYLTSSTPEPLPCITDGNDREDYIVFGGKPENTRFISMLQ